jgi:anti-anti-sigma factor
VIAALHMETLQDVPVARLVGEVDASNARELGERLIHAVPNIAMGLVLDLSETTYVDSSGVQLLFELADRLRRRQQDLHLVVPPDSFVADVMDAVNLRSSVQLDARVIDAVEALRSRDSG